MEGHVKIVKNWLGTGSINIFGRPFAGKDTQGKFLADLLDAELIAGGNILRAYHDQERIKSLMATGDLFPTDFYFQVVLPYLSRPEIQDKPLVLSTVGRMQGEEQSILTATAASGHPTKAVVVLQLSDEDVWRRFEVAQKKGDRGRRHDDDESVLVNRLEKFHEHTLPVIEFYREKGLVVDVDGTLPLEQVTTSLVAALAAYAKK